MQAYFQPTPNSKPPLEVCKRCPFQSKKLKNSYTYQRAPAAPNHCIYDKHFPFYEQNTYLYPSNAQMVKYTAPYQIYSFYALNPSFDFLFGQFVSGLCLFVGSNFHHWRFREGLRFSNSVCRLFTNAICSHLFQIHFGICQNPSTFYLFRILDLLILNFLLPICLFRLREAKPNLAILNAGSYYFDIFIFHYFAFHQKLILSFIFKFRFT